MCQSGYTLTVAVPLAARLLNMTSMVVVSITIPTLLEPGLMRLRQLCNRLRKICMDRAILGILLSLVDPAIRIEDNLLLLVVAIGNAAMAAVAGYISIGNRTLDQPHPFHWVIAGSKPHDVADLKREIGHLRAE